MPSSGGGGGGGTFNGGTITEPLVIALTDPAKLPLLIKPPAGSVAAGTSTMKIRDEGNTFNLVDLDASGNADFTTTDALGGIFTVNVQGGATILKLAPDAQQLVITTSNGAFAVKKQAGGTKVFQINDDGSLEGVTGKALTFDL